MTDILAWVSLISRYVLIKEFKRLSEQLGMKLPKGAGNIVDEAGAQIVKKYGTENLKKIDKIKNKNNEKIKELAKN